jgi:GntR family transcriptional repressor for pyruvate dehydrogenase complex
MILLNKTIVMPTKLADRLYEEILSAIVGGKLPEGHKLPSETELASAFGVSRPIVREALSRLRADSVVISRRGSGSYVQRRPSRQFLTLAPIGGVAELMRCFEFRIALEGEAVAIAAARRTEKDLAEIKAALDDLEKVIKKKDVGVKADIRFHNAIAAATRNHIFAGTMKALSEKIFSGMNVARRLSLGASTKRLNTVQIEHRQIYEAIKNRDPVKARETMRAHIDNARTRILSESVAP